MRIAVLVNSIADLVPRRATSLLAAAAADRGHRVGFVGVGEVGWSGGDLVVAERPIAEGASLEERVAAVQRAAPVRRRVVSGDVVLVRTNPGRDAGRREHHGAALGMLRLAQERGVAVLNDPAVLMRAGSKLMGLELPPSVQPPSLVSARREDLLAFVRESGGRCVVKPLVGTRGEGVHLVSAADTPERGTPLDAALDELLPSGPVLAQGFVPGAEQGDTRVLMVDGEPLELDGRLAAVRRVPSTSDFRSNIHAGATAHRAEWDPKLRRVVATMGPWLRERGLWLTGLDVIGDRVIEVNVFSPGGLGSAQQFEEVDFGGALIERLERRIGVG